MAGPSSLRPHQFLSIVVVFAVAVMLAFLPTTSSATDADALLDFKATLTGGGGGRLLNWDKGSTPCVGRRSDWAGLLCSNGTVTGLQLENMGLSGGLSIDPLVRLPGLRTLSFMNNSFDGPIPEIKKLGALKSIYLSMNELSGTIPDDAFANMGSLKKLHLSQNRFVGPIPSSVIGLPRLLELRLDGNGFNGSVPDLRQPELQLVNVSNNDLEGPIPNGLSKMDARLFEGNKNLCGTPLRVLCEPPPSPSKKSSTPLMAAIITVAVGATLLLIGAVLGAVRYRGGEKANLGGSRLSKNSSKSASSGDERQYRAPVTKNPKKMEQEPDEYRERTDAVATAVKAYEQARLVFVKELKGEWERFELQDLLKASAEAMGGGSLGSSYKAKLLSGETTVVVKRFKEMNALGREEFQEHMSTLGRLSHPNLLPLVAYYYRKEEKLLVTDYHPNGSLANQLHGNNPGLGWPIRLKIIKGVARGLAYLYDAFRTQNMPHGHLKSSNVLLDKSFEPLLSDYAFAPAMNQAHAAQSMVAYKAPETRQYGKLSKKSDVWSFGILVLEMLTGKLPDNYVKVGKTSTDLSSWVNSVIREEWTGEVFDSRMRGGKNCEGEMLKLLKIGMSCCERNVDKRWEMTEALERIEELRERDGDEDYSSYMSEGDFYSSRAMTEDDFSFSAKTC